MSDDLEVFFLEHPMPRLRPRDSARIIEPKLFRDDEVACRQHGDDGRAGDVICGCRRR